MKILMPSDLQMGMLDFVSPRYHNVCYCKAEATEIVGLEDFIFRLDDDTLSELYSCLEENEIFSLKYVQNKRKFTVISDKISYVF
jgi:hypothetical protein